MVREMVTETSQRKSPRIRRLAKSDVYDLLIHIPPGKVTTYGDIALALGCKRGSRAVGRILNRNPNPIVVPCHRVVMSNSRAGGYAYGTARKIELLKREGIRFSKDTLADFIGCRLSLQDIVETNKAGTP